MDREIITNRIMTNIAKNVLKNLLIMRFDLVLTLMNQ